MPVKWFGPKVKRRVYEAIRQGMDDTLAEAVGEIVSLTPVVTGRLSGSMRMEPTRIQGNKVTGFVGSFDINYAAKVEMHRRMIQVGTYRKFPKVKENIKRRLKAA